MSEQNVVIPVKPLKWYNFTVKFALWASAVIYLLGGLLFMTGKQYGDAAREYYEGIGGLKELDVTSGIVMIVIAVLCVITRYMLSGLYSKGPKLLLATYGLQMLLMAGYNIVNFILSERELDSLVTGVLSQVYMNAVKHSTGYNETTQEMFIGVTIGCACYLVLMALTWIYYRKRREIFTY